MKLEAGTDMTAVLQSILINAKSVGMLGVLVDVGKARPELFKGVLKPLVQSEHFYWWDDGRVQSLALNFAGEQLVSLGDTVFALARDWHFASHRQLTLRGAISGLVAEHPAFSADVVGFTGAWDTREDPKANLEQKLLAAQLDGANYNVTTDAESGQPKVEFICPTALNAEVTSFQQEKGAVLQALFAPEICLRILNQSNDLKER